MKVSGFSFIRNAIKFDYPILESIQSVLPLCDEFIIAVGNSDDKTLELIQGINDPKIKIIETVWNDDMRKGGRVLALETDKAFKEVSKDSDWAFYIQGDEVIHENDLEVIREGMLKWKDNKKVEGLLFNYIHFYGSYDFIGDSRRWYRKEIRIIKNNPEIKSYRDAQGFRINNRKLNVKSIDAFVYHYGWVKPPEIQIERLKSSRKIYRSDEEIENKLPNIEEFDYTQIDSLSHFKANHPNVMIERIKRINWEFNFDPSVKNLDKRTAFLQFIEKYTGWRIGEYKNYKII